MGAKSNYWVGLPVWLAVCFSMAFLGALGSVDAARLYSQLQQPYWAPPAFVFGPVWSVLYALMAIAIWRVWSRLARTRHPTIGLFVVHLGVNALWSWLFFAWELGFVALLNIVVLWLIIVAMLLQFWRYDKPAAWMLVPYLGWVSFAGVLNYTLWQLNPGLL
ncbi:TspO/MBR family protein [Gilvimarinus sp. SDUM040013]|uniref:TspO/MBR family protein n=1 Tax=Gilvimarinus gilvus TaxID=3058038 RepID=A0ABU4RTS7_9GAMM|nr:TspO/MBR family protein [Gilvimarinus sp. SDUM040013]MDO3386780.1 TspO/MBR family protein [Gilvimarinus sp. SDUM040013]MDX6848290.1 TspO/MBR family protein [Gilvimarinus sp. SDUM040013]